MLLQTQKRQINKIFKCFIPPERLTVSQWADKYRYLSGEFSAEAGKWNTSRAEYQRAIMDAVSNPAYEKVIVMSSSQIGKTECLLNIIGYFIHIDPCPMLLLFPTKDFAESFSKERLAPFIRDTKVIGKLVNDSVISGENSMLLKMFYGGYLAIIGANNPTNLSSRPVRVILADECDRYMNSAGIEGDPIELAIKRTVTFYDRKIVMVSTPTIAGQSRIEKEFKQSNQSHYYVPCHKCGEYQTLEFENIIISNPDDITNSAYYSCSNCNELWDDSTRIKAIRLGEWRQANPDVKNIAGFHLNELYSCWTRLGDIYNSYLKMKKYPETFKVFVNTTLGLPYSEDINPVDVTLTDRKELFDADTIPSDVVILTAGVDIQKDRFEIDVTGWGQDEEQWKIEYKIIYADPNKDESWQQLDDYLVKTFTRVDGYKLKISCVCIDSGAFTHKVYAFCKKREFRRVYAVKGSSLSNNPIISRPTARNTYKCKVFSIGTDTAKDTLFARLKIEAAGAGYIHFSNSLSDEYFNQLLAEKIVYVNKGGKTVKVYKKVRDRNEALDCAVYNLAAYILLSPNIAKIKERISQNMAKTDENLAINNEKNEAEDNNNDLFREIIKQRKALKKGGKSKFGKWGLV